MKFNRTLDTISDRMQASRPETLPLHNLDEPPHRFVLKREFSDGGDDVYIPSKVVGSLRSESSRVINFVKKREKDRGSLQSQWLAQEFVSSLMEVEIRFFCVGGEVIRNVFTGKHPSDDAVDPCGIWSYNQTESLKTIPALQ